LQFLEERFKEERPKAAKWQRDWFELDHIFD